MKRKKKLRLVRKQKNLPARLLNGAEIVMQHPQLRLIVEWLKEGTSCAAIARYMKESELITQSDRTFCDYLLGFKRAHPELLQDDSPISLDDVISANKPPVSVEKELHRMYRLQKIRLAVATKHELRRGRLNRDGHREMAVAHDYLQSLAKMGCTDNNTGADMAWNEKRLQHLDKDVRQKLLAIKKDEKQHERLYVLTLQLAEKITTSAMNQFPKTAESE